MEYGLIGEKLGHSFSKIIHSKLAGYEYELKEISKDNLHEFMTTKNFKAINVTIPYKQDVIPYLDVISDTAREIGAVNTIINKSGKLYGDNTDYSGLIDLIEYNDIKIKDKKVLILGSGGTSKTARVVAKNLDAKSVLCVSRSGGEGLITYEDLYKKHTDAEVIINTTPCGMYPNMGESAVDICRFSKLEAVIDAIYNPINSHLLIQAKKKGIKAVDGLYMLVAQAVFATEKFSDKTFPKFIIAEIVGEILKEKQNIVLIGMPGCGKSTIGKELAKELGKEFVDSDEEIVKKAGCTITEIFAKKGESEFRKIESEIIKELSAKQGLVIATGGGAVLNSRNVDFLKANGIILFLDRNIEDIEATADRPLSSNRRDLEKRYNERYPIYLSAADYRINCTNEINENIKTIKEVLKSENFSY